MAGWRHGCWMLALAASGCAAAPGALPTDVQAAAANYPPLILGGNVHATDGHEPPKPCPSPGTRVELKGGPVMAFNGADPSNPDLCLMTLDGTPAKAWYGIWITDWGGADQGRAALKQMMTAPSGTVAGFDVDMGPGAQYHDLVRNEGVEDIELLGVAYHALKISHYRVGANGNDYRSVSTIWKDIPTGVLIYGTYDHIAGKPEIDDPLIPTKIVAH